MMGVADGHGLQGHLVSQFVKVQMPKILSAMIHGGKEEGNKRNSFLPAISGSKQRNPFEIDGQHMQED
jgi:serine/threonine protein phosphatase PrpC